MLYLCPRFLSPPSPPKLGGWGSEQARDRSKGSNENMTTKANINSSNNAMQKNTDSLASFNALYLHISEKVLTHTHTHRTWCRHLHSFTLRARVRHGLNPNKQRASRSSLCSSFYVLLPTEQKENNAAFIH